MKKRLLACFLAISIFVMMIPLEVFADSPAVHAYAGSGASTAVAGRGQTLILTASSTGFSGNVRYQWYRASSATPYEEGASSTAIDGAVGTTYEAPTDTVGTYYYYCKCNSDFYSNIVTVVVHESAIIFVSADPGSGGTVHGDGIYTLNSPCTVTATQSSGYTFAGWKENGAVVSNDAQYTFTATGNRTLSAAFTINSAINDTITVNRIRYKVTSLTPPEVSVVGASLIGKTALKISPTLKYNGIDYSVTSIGDVAFLNCTSLTSIIIPGSVTYIGDSAFAACTSLTKITLPNSVTSIIFDTFDLIPSDAVFYGDNQERPASWDSFWQPTYRYVTTGTAVLPAQTTISGVGSVMIKTPGNDLGNISGVLTPVSTATTDTLLAAANAGLPGGTYQVVAGAGLTLSGSTEALLVGQPTTIGIQITGETGAFDMTRAIVIHQYGNASAIEALSPSWNADRSFITVVTTNGASPFVIVAPLKTPVNNPHTGDRLWIPLWGMIALLVSGALASLFILMRKRKAS